MVWIKIAKHGIKNSQVLNPLSLLWLRLQLRLGPARVGTGVEEDDKLWHLIDSRKHGAVSSWGRIGVALGPSLASMV